MGTILVYTYIVWLQLCTLYAQLLDAGLTTDMRSIYVCTPYLSRYKNKIKHPNTSEQQRGLCVTVTRFTQLLFYYFRDDASCQSHRFIVTPSSSVGHCFLHYSLHTTYLHLQFDTCYTGYPLAGSASTREAETGHGWGPYYILLAVFNYGFIRRIFHMYIKII